MMRFLLCRPRAKVRSLDRIQHPQLKKSGGCIPICGKVFEMCFKLLSTPYKIPKIMTSGAGKNKINIDDSLVRHAFPTKIHPTEYQHVKKSPTQLSPQQRLQETWEPWLRTPSLTMLYPSTSLDYLLLRPLRWFSIRFPQTCCVKPLQMVQNVSLH